MFVRVHSSVTVALTIAFVMIALPACSYAQTGAARDTVLADDVDAIVRHALLVSPVLRVAESRLAAAQARIRPSGVAPDPMIMAGLVSQPLGSMKAEASASTGSTAGMPSLPDMMTMKMIGVTQTFIYPGKLPALRRIAEMEAKAAQAEVETTRIDITRSAKEPYYELSYLDHAIGITERSSAVLATIVRVTETRYSAGTSGQQDVLKARVESAQLSETANMLAEQRTAALAQLNAVIDQPSDAVVVTPSIPARILRAAVASDAVAVRFVAPTIGSRAANSPLPSVLDLQAMAIERSPALRSHEAMIDAQAARVESARIAYKPDFDVSLQYGQRKGRPDMITALVSAPLRLHRRSREDKLVADASSELTAMHAEHQAQVNVLRAEISKLAAEIDRNRTQLAIYSKAILPQAQAGVDAGLASYQAGRTDLLSVLDSQNTAFTYELSYYRALSDFAINVAKLEQMIGAEVIK
ncbi:MAG: TolC family protein [Longimicrobiales bacterium]